MNRRLLIASAFAAALLVSTTTLAQKGQVRSVNRPVLSMYSSATTDTDVVSQAIYGTPVTILGEKDGWAEVRTPDDYTGWVETSALVASGSATPYLSGSSKVIQVRSLFAHIYREASVTRHAPMLTVPFETKLEADPSSPQKSERWLQVRLPDGRTGFIQSGDIGPVTTNLTVPETIELARKFLGMPYTWGGTSSFGFDCSGYTQMLMRQRGYAMPRDAGPQARWERFVAVDRAGLQPGDLLFFGSAIEKVTHTGMYIGDGLFINATTHETPMVRIDNLDDAYWMKIFVGARRPK
jgi:SH3-like domain-containing protein